MLFALILSVLMSVPVSARTPTPTAVPTNTDGPSPTPTATDGTPTPTTTGTPALPEVHLRVFPDTARTGQLVTLDGSGNDPNASYSWTQVGIGPAIQIENADQPLASFIVPELTGPAVVSIQLTVSGYNTGPQTRGIIVLPTDMVVAFVTGGNAPPGERAPVHVTLRSYGIAVTELEHQIGFGSFAPIADRGDGVPACEPGPQVTATSSSFAFVPDGCVPSGTCTGVRAAVTTRDPIPEDGIAYQCEATLVDRPSTPEQGCYHVIECVDGTARDRSGRPLTLRCSESKGGVGADYALRPLSFTFTADPPTPNVGDAVHVTFTAIGDGGLPAYRLRGAEPILHGMLEVQPGGPLGEVSFELTADCPGTAPLSLEVNYEALAGCLGATYYRFVYAFSPLFPLIVREPGFFRVTGQVAELPPGCSGTRPYAHVRLDPLGWLAQADETGAFAFDGVPPGEYTVAIADGCGTFQCWSPHDVHVADQDVALTLCPQRLAGDACLGDCDLDNVVRIDELIVGIGMALGDQPFSACPAVDGDGDGEIEVNEIVAAVASSLQGCGPSLPAP